jgi:hypothetical protein
VGEAEREIQPHGGHRERSGRRDAG